MTGNAWCEMEEIDRLITQIIKKRGNKAHLDACAEHLQNIARSYLLSEATPEGQALLTREWREEDEKCPTV